MKPATLLIPLLVPIVAVACSGCLVEQTVTRNGEVVKEGYAIKRPIKEAMENSEGED
jgi:outer membrane protein assembly factor BamE (lipoprotein component of BamABCDE complex)